MRDREVLDEILRPGEESGFGQAAAGPREQVGRRPPFLDQEDLLALVLVETAGELGVDETGLVSQLGKLGSEQVIELPHVLARDAGSQDAEDHVGSIHGRARSSRGQIGFDPLQIRGSPRSAMETQSLGRDRKALVPPTVGQPEEMLRFLLLRFLPRRLVPLLMLLEVVRVARRLGAAEEDRRRSAAARRVGPGTPERGR
jgi:hypothetical protein